MLCNGHHSHGGQLSSLLMSLARAGGAFSIPYEWTKISLGRFSSGEDAEAILQGD